MSFRNKLSTRRTTTPEYRPRGVDYVDRNDSDTLIIDADKWVLVRLQDVIQYAARKNAWDLGNRITKEVLNESVVRPVRVQVRAVDQGSEGENLPKLPKGKRKRVASNTGRQRREEA